MRRIPATIVTGFLGSGKTTTLRAALERAEGRRIAVIVNEFGDLGVDGEIIAGCGIEGCAEEDVVELANGCICCAVLPASTMPTPTGCPKYIAPFPPVWPRWTTQVADSPISRGRNRRPATHTGKRQKLSVPRGRPQQKALMQR